VYLFYFKLPFNTLPGFDLTTSSGGDNPTLMHISISIVGTPRHQRRFEGQAAGLASGPPRDGLGCRLLRVRGHRRQQLDRMPDLEAVPLPSANNLLPGGGVALINLVFIYHKYNINIIKQRKNIAKCVMKTAALHTKYNLTQDHKPWRGFELRIFYFEAETMATTPRGKG
jgi:hypothetical protein